MNRIAYLKATCPHCKSNDLLVTGANGSVGRTVIVTLLSILFMPIGLILIPWFYRMISARTIASDWPIKYKCKKCDHKFTREPVRASQEEMLSAPCVIEFERISSLVGAAMPQIVHINGVKVASIKNGKTIAFQTLVKHNVIFVTDQYGNAFLGQYTFEAEANTSVLLRFNRVFKEPVWKNLSSREKANLQAVEEGNTMPLPIVSEPAKNAENMHDGLSDKVCFPDQEPLSLQSEYNGIQWYFKVLKQYADFSGRARRKEYWMFVLFNVIFSFAWSFLLTLLIMFPHGGMADPTIVYSYSVAMILPSIAVAVRRLHDTGKSGWWMLIGLIPIVGGIWLFILMLEDSQSKANEYGQNPKIAPHKLNEQTKLKSAGVTLIVASIVALLINVYNIVSFGFYGYNFFFWIPTMVAFILLLSAGFFLINEKQISIIRGSGKNAMLLLLTASTVFFLMRCVGLFQSIGHRWNVIVLGNHIYTILYLLLACFAASILFMQQNKKLIRMAAVCVIVFAGFHLFWEIFFGMGSMSRNAMNIWLQIFRLSGILLPIAYIILAWTYLSEKRLSIPAFIPVSIPDPVPAKAYIHENMQEKARNIEPVQEKVRNTVYIDTMQMCYYLEHKADSMYHKSGENQRISAEQVELGRDPGCEVRFDEQFTTVSRRHAAIIKDGENRKLIPISQTNSTFVNGIRVHKEWFLQNNDEIQCALNGPVLVFKDAGLG